MRVTRDRWTDRHRAWLAKVELPERGAHATFLDYLGAITALEIRREALETTICELAPASRWATDIARLRCLRGIDTLSAVGLCAEVGDFARFERPAQLMSYLGLVPSERTTGEARRQGQITKSGSSLARWLLIEAAWHYRHTPRVATKLARRQQGQAPAAIALAWKTQQRLYQLWRRLDHKRGKRRQLVAVAIARHLAGFCWAIVTLDPHPTQGDDATANATPTRVLASGTPD